MHVIGAAITLRSRTGRKKNQVANQRTRRRARLAARLRMTRGTWLTIHTLTDHDDAGKAKANDRAQEIHCMTHTSHDIIGSLFTAELELGES